MAVPVAGAVPADLRRGHRRHRGTARHGAHPAQPPQDRAAGCPTPVRRPRQRGRGPRAGAPARRPVPGRARPREGARPDAARRRLALVARVGLGDRAHLAVPATTAVRIAAARTRPRVARPRRSQPPRHRAPRRLRVRRRPSASRAGGSARRSRPRGRRGRRVARGHLARSRPRARRCAPSPGAWTPASSCRTRRSATRTWSRPCGRWWWIC